jgi:hypothetical protein
MGSFGVFKKAHGIAVDAVGSIYVTDSEDDCVQKFDSNFNPVTISIHSVNKPVNSFGTTGLLTGQLKHPAGITYEKVSGQLAVADSLNGRIQFFDKDGNYLSKVGAFGSGPLKFTMPKGIAFEYDSTGTAVSRYYVVDSFQSNIQVIDAATKTFQNYIGSYGYDLGSLVAPSDVEVDQSNPLTPVLIVANEIGLITRYGIDSLEPTDVKVLPPTEVGKLKLTWTNPLIPTFSSIHIYQSTTPGSIGTLIGGNIVGATSYTDANLIAGTTYYYTVRGVNNSSAESPNTNQVSGTTLSSYLLTVEVAGTGDGTISSNLPLPGLTYNSGTNPPSYTALVNSGTPVTISANHGVSSFLSSWTGGVCNNSTLADCGFTMASNVTVRANFDKQFKFKIDPSGIYSGRNENDTLQFIYNQATDGDTIMAMSGVSPAYDVATYLAMTAANNIKVTIAGGYDAEYSSASGFTTLTGRINVRAGKVVFKNIKIK